MRLVSPSPGECADRESILTLKIEFAGMRGADITHFREELDSIEAYMLKSWWPKINGQAGVYEAELRDLVSVNRKLWVLESEARIVVKEKRDARAVELLELITGLNDLRANCVKRINSLFGIAQQEKFY